MPNKVPEIVFKTRVRDESVEGPNPFRWQDVSSEEIFAGKKIVLFALPGAFTPTCSSTHLPRYEELYEQLQAEGVDVVALAKERREDLGHGKQALETLKEFKAEREAEVVSRR